MVVTLQPRSDPFLVFTLRRSLASLCHVQTLDLIVAKKKRLIMETGTTELRKMVFPELSSLPSNPPSSSPLCFLHLSFQPPACFEQEDSRWGAAVALAAQDRRRVSLAPAAAAAAVVGTRVRRHRLPVVPGARCRRRTQLPPRGDAEGTNWVVFRGGGGGYLSGG